MSQLSSILGKIRTREASICVLGLGHVGLPTAILFSEAGFKVAGVDADQKKVDDLNKWYRGESEAEYGGELANCARSRLLSITQDFGRIQGSDFVVLCVQTPVANGIPDLKYVENATRTISEYVHRGMTVLLESTVPPGTTAGLVASRLCDSGLVIDRDLYLAHCPERLTPGQALEEFVNNVRVVGGIGPNSTRIAAELYRTVCRNVRETDATTAEVVKLAENTFRYVNIAYANLLALIAQRIGVDVREIIALANTHPRVNIHSPGIGVGGPCLPKDPWLLTYGSARGFDDLIQSARMLNENMPTRSVQIILSGLSNAGVEPKGAKVSLLGVTYKADVNDITNSPAQPIVRELREMGVRVMVYDPYSPETFGAERARNLEECLSRSDCVLLATDHSAFRSFDLAMLREITKRRCIVFDGRGLFAPAQIQDLGLTYLGIGYGKGQRNRES